MITTKYQHIMSRAFLLVVFSFPIILSAQNLQKNLIDQNFAEGTGRAELKVVPNQIDIQIINNKGEGKGKPVL